MPERTLNGNDVGGQLILEAADGHRLAAYGAEPARRARGGVVVLHERFGVNRHIRTVCDRLAEAGFVAVAPALFDRIEPGFECGYEPQDARRALRFLNDPDLGEYLRDTQAAVTLLRARGAVSVLGFGLGGTVAFAAAAGIDSLASVVSYCGEHVRFHADGMPRCPTLMHFGALDQDIAPEHVAHIRALRGGDCEIRVYEGAGHGFDCDERDSFHPEAAKLAWQRTLAWLERAHP